MRDLINKLQKLLEENEIEFLQYPEGYEPESLPERHPLDTIEWSWKAEDDVIQMMKSLEHKIKARNLWDKALKLADYDENKLWRVIQYEAEHIMDRYRGSGEGIGSSDMNYFVRAVFRELGEDDVWGWDKPKDPHPSEPNWPHQSESLEEDADVATAYGGPYESTENYEGKQVKITRTSSGEHVGEVGTVVKADKYRDDTGGWQAEFDIELESGKTIKLFPGEWSYDQVELVADPYKDWKYENPFESLEEDFEIFKREMQNPQWRERLAAEREKRIAYLAKRGNRPEDHHMRRVMTPKGKGTIYSINNHEPSEFHAPTLTASVRLDSDPGGYGGGKQQVIFKLDDLEFIDDDYDILESLKEDYHSIPRERIKRFADLVYNIKGGIVQRLLLKGRGLSREAAEKKLVNDGFSVSEIQELESWLKKAIENVAGEENLLMTASPRNFGGWSHVTWSDDEAGMKGIGLDLESEKEFNRKVMDEFKKIAWVQPGKRNLDEEVVEVPAGLRGEEGSHLSTRDAEEFINSLGPEDSPDTEVIDPDSGDVLDWPDTATRRDQEERAERERQDREEEEAWDTPMLYTSDLKKHDDRSWDRISDFRFNAEFTDHYDVEWANIEDLVDNPQQYYEGDYDIGVDIPVKISRTDGKKFDKQDRENFKQLYKLFRLATYNISVAYAGSSNDGTVAHFYPTFF